MLANQKNIFSPIKPVCPNQGLPVSVWNLVGEVRYPVANAIFEKSVNLFHNSDVNQTSATAGCFGA
eukprot:15316744-Ditylum_brightwellii.AAC.1